MHTSEKIMIGFFVFMGLLIWVFVLFSHADDQRPRTPQQALLDSLYVEVDSLATTLHGVAETLRLYADELESNTQSGEVTHVRL